MGLLRLGLALPSLLNGVHEAVVEEIDMVLHSRDERRGTKRNREEGGAGEGEEEEVEVEEDAEVEPHRDTAALMQTRRTGQGRPTPKEESWRPLTRSEKKRIAMVVRALLKFQDKAEPSLTVLAFVDEPPTMCDSGQGPEEERPPGFARGTATCPDPLAVGHAQTTRPCSH